MKPVRVTLDLLVRDDIPEQDVADTVASETQDFLEDAGFVIEDVRARDVERPVNP